MKLDNKNSSFFLQFMNQKQQQEIISKYKIKNTVNEDYVKFMANKFKTLIIPDYYKKQLVCTNPISVLLFHKFAKQSCPELTNLYFKKFNIDSYNKHILSHKELQEIQKITNKNNFDNANLAVLSSSIKYQISNKTKEYKLALRIRNKDFLDIESDIEVEEIEKYIDNFNILSLLQQQDSLVVANLQKLEKFYNKILSLEQKLAESETFKNSTEQTNDLNALTQNAKLQKNSNHNFYCYNKKLTYNRIQIQKIRKKLEEEHFRIYGPQIEYLNKLENGESVF